jgi:hypothetical protein
MARKRKQFCDAGFAMPMCVVCRESDLCALELDHIAGRANSTQLVALCANCHAIKSDMAEDAPMAALRHADANRSALALQAAFELGLAAILSLFGAVELRDGEAGRVVFFGIAAAVLIAWAIWNLCADEHFTEILGPGYDKAIAAVVPS